MFWLYSVAGKLPQNVAASRSTTPPPHSAGLTGAAAALGRWLSPWADGAFLRMQPLSVHVVSARELASR